MALPDFKNVAQPGFNPGATLEQAANIYNRFLEGSQRWKDNRVKEKEAALFEQVMLNAADKEQGMTPEQARAAMASGLVRGDGSHFMDLLKQQSELQTAAANRGLLGSRAANLDIQTALAPERHALDVRDQNRADRAENRLLQGQQFNQSVTAARLPYELTAANLLNEQRRQAIYDTVLERGRAAQETLNEQQIAQRTEAARALDVRLSSLSPSARQSALNELLQTNPELAQQVLPYSETFQALQAADKAELEEAGKLRGKQTQEQQWLQNIGGNAGPSLSPRAIPAERITGPEVFAQLQRQVGPVVLDRNGNYVPKADVKPPSSLQATADHLSRSGMLDLLGMGTYTKDRLIGKKVVEGADRSLDSLKDDQKALLNEIKAAYEVATPDLVENQMRQMILLQQQKTGKLDISELARNLRTFRQQTVSFANRKPFEQTPLAP